MIPTTHFKHKGMEYKEYQFDNGYSANAIKLKTRDYNLWDVAIFKKDKLCTSLPLSNNIRPVTRFLHDGDVNRLLKQVKEL